MDDKSTLKPAGGSVLFIPDEKRANPYQSLLAKSLNKFQFQVEYLPKNLRNLVSLAFNNKKVQNIIHVHWLDAFISADSRMKMIAKAAVTLLCFLMLKIRGKKIFYTLHNLQSHESRYPVLERRIYSCFLGMVDGVFAHCNNAAELLGNIHGESNRKKVCVVPHGSYLGAYPERVEMQAAREQLGLSSDKLIFLFVGLIRPYKGLIALLDSMQQLDSPDVQLIIAGKIASDKDSLLAKAAQDPRVALREGFVKDKELALLLSASNLFVAPFRQSLTSGSVILAMSYGLPCIAPALGCLPETLRKQQALLYDPEIKGALLKTLKIAADQRRQLAAMGRNNLESARTELDWEISGALTAGFYDYVSKKV